MKTTVCSNFTKYENEIYGDLNSMGTVSKVQLEKFLDHHVTTFPSEETV